MSSVLDIVGQLEMLMCSLISKGPMPWTNCVPDSNGHSRFIVCNSFLDRFVSKKQQSQLTCIVPVEIGKVDQRMN